MRPEQISFATCWTLPTNSEMSFKRTARSSMRERSTITARDSQCFVDAAVGMRGELADSELFASTTEASNSFRAVAAGFSPTRRSSRLDGLELRTTTWRIQAADIRHVRSSFFDDRVAFPAGSIRLDSALVMRDVTVEWHSFGSLSPCHRDPSLAPA